MAYFLSKILDETGDLARAWNARLGDGKTLGKSAAKLDVYGEARRLTLEVVLRVSFGVK